MSTASRVIAASLATLAFAGTAFAQDATTTGEPAAEGEPATATDGSALPTGEVTPENPAPGPALRWPRDIVSRVLTLPKGLAMVGADLLGALNPPVGDPFDPIGFRLVVGYGITDDFELNAATYLFTSKEAKGDLGVGVGYKLVRGAAGGKLEAIARVATGYNLLAEGIDPLALGVHVQYNITPKLAVITPGGQLNIGLADETGKGKSLDLPVSIGFQATPTLYLQADTKLAHIKLADTATTVIFSDTTPLTLGAYLNAIPALDVYVALGMDVTPPAGGVGDTLFLTAGARYYIGQL